MKRWLQRPAREVHLEASGSGANPVMLADRGQVEHESLSARDRGDHARDGKAWIQAAQFYENHLKVVPDDTAIWVQLGHARKESGDYARAEEAYRTAISLSPTDADVPLQLGHLMKLIGRTRDATELYTTALRLQPSSNAYRELVGLGQAARADRLIGSLAMGSIRPTIYLQINDLLHFLRVHKTPSGIQRVQLGILTYCLAERPGADEPQAEFVFNQPNDTQVWKVSRARLRRMVDYLDGLDVDTLLLRQLVDEILEDAVLVKPGKGDSFVIIGAFWGMPGNTHLLSSLSEQGASLGVYLYDLIPITFPEYCAHQLTVEFTADLCEALQLVDFALAISEYTAREIKSFIQEHNFPSIPVRVIPLAHSLTGLQASSGHGDIAGADWTDATERLQERDFVLCVCTIEPRKNHRYLFDAWKFLKQEGVSVPDLVFVGRKGWHVGDFMAQLENTDYLDGSIVVVHDLSDTELATLYRACRFTVFPSVVEGWGLPLGESLSFGKLCVSSNTSSMPEVGQDLVEYVDPLNLREGIETFRRLITKRDEVDEWERRIQSKFHPRSWEHVAKQFLSVTSDLLSKLDGVEKRHSPRLRSGIPLRVSDLVRTGKTRSIQDHVDLQALILSGNWYPPENFGAWMKGSSGNIRFATGLSAGRTAIIHLEFVTAANADQVKVVFSTSLQPAQELSVSASQSLSIRLRAVVEKTGDISIGLKTRGSYDAAMYYPRVFCIGLVSVAFVDAEDLVGRAELLERVLIEHGQDTSSSRLSSRSTT
ncbi:glycosyltransferase [Acetobacteraceae bacterium]|nr:glycosyltransferase [Acetobacteraceae bacterium]